jgi:DNA-binding HxlR family transcriptional regulator
MLQFVKHCARIVSLMSDRRTCPVCRTAEIVCGKWTLLVIRDLADGRSRFCELERSLAGISPRTLSLRLRALEEEGIVERQTFPEVPPRVEYVLTRKGRALVPLIESMRAYGREWLGGDCAERGHGADTADDPHEPLLVAGDERAPVGAAA